MILKFEKWLVENTSVIDPNVSKKEKNDLAGVDDMSPIQQAQLDIDLHKKALKDPRDRFDNVQDQELLADIETKERLKKVFQNPLRTSTAEIQEVISRLKRDMDIHQKYLDQPESDNTGTHGWHRTWINIYRNWINDLESQLSKDQESEEKSKPVLGLLPQP